MHYDETAHWQQDYSALPTEIHRVKQNGVITIRKISSFERCSMRSVLNMKRAADFRNTNCVSAPSHSFMPFITGVLKQRYADFQVYEINRDNQKAVIDSLLKRSLKKKRGSESNETDTGKSSNKRPRNIDKLLRRAKRRKVKASLMWQNRNDFWRRYLCGSTGHSGESLMSSDSDELIKKIADRQSSSLSRWQSYLVYGGKQQEPLYLQSHKRLLCSN